MTQPTQGAQARQDAMDLTEGARTEEWQHPSFMAELFNGKLRADLVFPYPEQSEADRREGDVFLQKLEAFLAANHDPDEVDRTGEIPPHVLEGLKKLGAFGMKIDKDHGGLGLSQTNYLRALALLGGHCGNLTAWLSAHQSIGVPQPLKYFGTKEQKDRYLGRLTREVSAFALTEPGVGSDPAAMTTRAEPSPDGKHWILNGQKLWCTNGAVADVILVMARTPDKMVGGKPRKQISSFIVEKTMPGFRVVHRCRFMGLHGIQNALLELKDVKVPAENLVGEPGQGLKIAFSTLNAGRLGLPGANIGVGKKCLEYMRKWTAERVQWGTPIGNHEEVAYKNALVASYAFAIEAITYWAGAIVDRGGMDIRCEAAAAKLLTTEMAWKVAYETLQTRGGRGFENALSLKARGEAAYPVERMFRDMRINTILEGSTEIMHLFIAREALDAHMQRVKPLLDPRSTAFAKLAAVAKAAMHYAFWYPKLWLPPLTALPDLQPALRGHVQYVAKTSKKLARSTFHLMLRHRDKLEHRGLALARIVEIGCELFTMSVTCAKAEQLLAQGEGPHRNCVELADLYCREAKLRIQKHFEALHNNNDKRQLAVSQSIMAGLYQWLEEGTFQSSPASMQGSVAKAARA